MEGKVAIIDYGVGNLKSVYNAFRYLGSEPVLVNSPKELEGDYIVVPGVGAFGKGMEKLAAFQEVIREKVSEGIPLLGVCLGLHVMFEGSDESPGIRGLGIIKGRVLKIPTELKLPHIGWNYLKVKRQCPLFDGIRGGHVYFVHSYHVSPEEDVVVATTDYGAEVVAAVWRENVFGTQFHPEKSGSLGLKVLHNFLRVKDAL